MNHSLHSDEYNRRKENFNKGLMELDKKYIEYFKPRLPPKYSSQKHDSIVYHFMIIDTHQNPALNITSTELPKEIMVDLTDLFHQHWD